MGSAIGTTGLSVLATAAFIVAAILSIIASDRLRSIAGYNTNDTFKAANNDLTIAMVLAWIAAGISFLMMIGYIFTSFELLQNETLHFILWILALAAAIISFIYLGFASRKVDNTENDNGVQGYLLWAMIILGLGLAILLLTGLWRITHHVTKPKPVKTPDTTNTYVVPDQDTYTDDYQNNYQNNNYQDIPPPVSGYAAEKPTDI